MLARLGGDEFLILFPETRSELAQRAMNRIKDRLFEEVLRKRLACDCEHRSRDFSIPACFLRRDGTNGRLSHVRGQDHGENSLVSSIHRDGDSSA